MLDHLQHFLILIIYKFLKSTKEKVMPTHYGMRMGKGKKKKKGKGKGKKK